MYKNMQNKIYGSSELDTQPSSKRTMNKVLSRLRGPSHKNGAAARSGKIPLRTHYRTKADTSKQGASDTTVKVRQPSLKHELKGPPINHLENQINMYAQDQPIFNKRSSSLQHIVLHDKNAKASRPTSSKEEPSPLQTQQKLMKQTEAGEGANSDDKEADLNDFKKGVSHIKNQQGFDARVRSKLDDIINP